MPKTPAIVAPQPQQRTIMRRVNMRRCLVATLWVGNVLVLYSGLTFVSHVPWVPWLAVLLLILTGTCAAFATYFWWVEAPTPVDVVEHVHHHTPPIIH